MISKNKYFNSNCSMIPTGFIGSRNILKLIDMKKTDSQITGHSRDSKIISVILRTGLASAEG